MVIVLIKFLNISEQILFLVLFMFFSLLPDLDSYSSKISKSLRVVSFFVKLLSSHRGLLHGVFIPFFVSLILFVFNHKFLALAVFLGYLSHLVLDAVTVGGIVPFAPLFNKKIRGFIKVGSFLENLVFLILIVLIIGNLI